MSDQTLFEQFIELPSNRFALCAAKSAAIMPGKAYNPLWIYGPTGNGKTALLDAVEEVLRSGTPHLTPLRVQTEHVIGELVRSITDGTGEYLRSRFAQADAIVLDQAEVLHGKPFTQKLLGQLLAEAVHQGHQVLASSCHPDALAQLRDALGQRCESHLQVEIVPPDAMERTCFAQALFRRLELPMGDNSCIRIADGTRSLAQVRCAVTCIDAHRQLLGQDEGELLMFACLDRVHRLED